MLREKNLQLTELQFCINNIATCLGIVDLLSARRQDHQWNTLIQCETLFTSQLSTNHNNFQQDSDVQTKTKQSTIPTKNIILIMSPSTNKWSCSSENITISTEATTIPTSPSPFVSKYYFDISLKYVFARSDEISNESDQRYEKQQEIFGKK